MERAYQHSSNSLNLSFYFPIYCELDAGEKDFYLDELPRCDPLDYLVEIHSALINEQDNRVGCGMAKYFHEALREKI